MKKNNNNICRMTLLALPLLMLSACSQDDTITAGQTITLTTPVIQLDGVQASSRAEQGQNLADVAEWADIHLYLHDSEAREENYDRYGLYLSESDWTWTARSSATVTGGEGHYRAGIFSYVKLNDTADMPEIINAIYAYRGSINVKADGTFTPDPDGTLESYSAAVLLKLKDADGNDIDPTDSDATNGMESSLYLIKPVGLAQMAGFVPMDAYGNVNGDNGESFPNGTADPVPAAWSYSSYKLVFSAYGNFTPGTYPATWTEGGQLVTSTTSTAPWPLFEVTYCKDGFDYNNNAEFVPAGDTFTTWTVSYPASQQLTLEAGKLYTFTATLGGSAHITLDAENAVTVSNWATGSTINVGR